jgi:hypothetical protein
MIENISGKDLVKILKRQPFQSESPRYRVYIPKTRKLVDVLSMNFISGEITTIDNQVLNRNEVILMEYSSIPYEKERIAVGDILVNDEKEYFVYGIVGADWNIYNLNGEYIDCLYENCYNKYYNIGNIFENLDDLAQMEKEFNEDNNVDET